MSISDVPEQFLALLRSALEDGSFRRVVLAKPRSKSEFTRVTVREVLVRDQRLLSFVQSYPTKDITKNLSTADGIDLIGELISSSFLRAHLLGSNENVDLSISKKGSGALHRSMVMRAATHGEEVSSNGLSAADDSDQTLTGDTHSMQHDRTKHRFVQQDRPYLPEIGITDSSGRIVASMARKWKQINKFVEIVDSAIKESALKDSTSLSVVDFGSGKGYLTFALHDYLRTELSKQATVRGIELRPDLVDACNLAAHRTHADGLTFVCGEIATEISSETIDILVALHACDTATDLAIHRGITRGANIIVCSPCCHKELRPQIHAPNALAPLLQFGVHLGQEADMVTDTLRALLLESNGYDTKVFEFVGLEHSSKNKMILAVKRHDPNLEKQARASGEISELKAFYGITTQHLESLLAR